MNKFEGAARVVLASVLTSFAVTAGAAESVDSYPSKSIRLLVPFAAGGGVDITSRQLAKALEPAFKQSLVVENRPGAGGNIGADIAAHAPPDGYTIFMGAAGPNVVNQYLMGKLPYDPVADFIPVTMTTRYDYVVVVAANSPLKSLKDLIQTAKQSPGKLNFGITAIGGPAHLAVELFKREANINVVGVPYKGSPEATIDLFGGRIDFMFDPAGPQAANFAAGRVRVLANTAGTKSLDFPNIERIADAGFKNFSVIGWAGMFVPAKTPAPIVDKIFVTVKKTLQGSEFSVANRKPGESAITSTSSKEFADFLTAERAMWSAVIRDANIKL